MENITKSGDISTHLVWIGIQLTINTHIFMQIFTSFQWRPFWKFKMAVTTAARSRVFIYYMILIIKNYQYTKFNANIHKYNKVIEILSFQWRPFWKFKMAVTTATRWRVFISNMILTIKKLSIHTISCFYENLNNSGVWCPLTALLLGFLVISHYYLTPLIGTEVNPSHPTPLNWHPLFRQQYARSKSWQIKGGALETCKLQTICVTLLWGIQPR